MPIGRYLLLPVPLIGTVEIRPKLHCLLNSLKFRIAGNCLAQWLLLVCFVGTLKTMYNAKGFKMKQAMIRIAKQLLGIELEDLSRAELNILHILKEQNIVERDDSGIWKLIE